MSLNTNFGFIHNPEYRLAFCLCFVFLKISTIDQEEIVCIEELSCPVSSVCLCGRLQLGVAHCNVALDNNNKKKKKPIYASCFSIAHACHHLHAYYRYRNAYGWEVSEFLNHNLSPLSLSLPLTRSAHLNPSVTKISTEPFCQTFLLPPFLSEIYEQIHSPLLFMSSLFSLFAPLISLPLLFLVWWALSFSVLADQKAWHL